MKDGKNLATIALVGLGLWALQGAKPAEATSEVELARLRAELEKASQAERAKLEAQITALQLEIAQQKAPMTETPTIPLDVWQGLTREEVAKLPVTQEKGTVGVSDYYKTSKPVAIGDTGFKIWGMTESGSVVMSTKDPASYEAWEWY